MNNYAKLVAVAAALVATPALSAPVGVTGGSGPPTASARIVKPLTLTATGALNFGVVVIPAGGVTADRTVTLNTDTTITCDTELVCAANGTIPTYNVAGTQGQTVTIIKTASSLTGSNGGSLQLTPIGQANVVLANSGAPGSDFPIGGSILITSSTVDGLYTGTVNVTVDY